MKTAIFLTLLVTLSASADSVFSSSPKAVHKKDSVAQSGPYMTGSTEVKDHSREVASQKTEKKELPMKDDSYFTGSSLK